MIEFLDSILDTLRQCDAFLIEQQMQFRGVYNVDCVKLGQHCFSYLCFKLGRGTTIIEYPAYHKTQILGASKAESKKKADRKKFSIRFGSEVLENRGELETLLTPPVGSKKKKIKKDDICDCLLMNISYKILRYIDGLYKI